jgi:carbon monoxide dehydrogenase subunit G
MIAFEKSIFINRPLQVVWDFVSNPANDLQWGGGTEVAEWTSEGPPGVGSTVRWVVKSLGRKIESTAEMTKWDPPNQYSFKSVSGPMTFEGTRMFESKENGTQMSVRAKMEFGGILRLAEGLLGKQAVKQLDADFENLKRVLESGQV